jgi:hypothetical protein
VVAYIVFWANLVFMKVKSRSNGKSQESGTGTRARTRKLAANPWRTYAGIWRDNPDVDDLLKEIKAIRRESATAEEA